MKLEQTILSIAKQRLMELESYAKDPLELDNVINRFFELSGLVELANFADNGLSNNAIIELKEINKKSIEILHQNKTLRDSKKIIEKIKPSRG